MLDRLAAINRINQLATGHIPFFFFTDFLGTQTWIKPVSEIDPAKLRFAFHQSRRFTHTESYRFVKYPPSRAVFDPAFRYVQDQINFGNSYLVNLTFRTPLDTSLTLEQIYEMSSARYKVLFADQFVVFSPETFVKIENGRIFSYPMKGTIDAQVQDARQVILNDPKETAEHVTIVDLIRNDLSLVAEDVTVTNFRFITEVKTHEKTLLQVSSEICGQLPPDYLARLGDILFSMLPAGSISGAPKDKTLRIIEAAENYNRGFYTGICGYFDGEKLDTGVMIRFIEQENHQLYYKSGGGITTFSQADKEYQELIDKIYIPSGL